MDQISLVEVEPQLVIGMRQRGGYERIGQMLMLLYQYAAEHGAQIAGPPVYICHEMGEEEAQKASAEGNAELEVAFPISLRVEESEDVKCYELPGGLMAKVVHKGPYEACSPTYQKLFDWISTHDKKIVGFTREVYLNDPSQVSQEELLTEILAPVV